MPRTYSFDHFTARPAVGAQKRVRGANDKQSVNQGEVIYQSGVHYGHAHSQTEALYQKHRAEHDLRETLRDESPRSASEIPVSSEPPGVPPDVAENLSIARQAIERVVDAARETLRGGPRTAGIHLLRDAVIGSLHVVRQVSHRVSRWSSDLLEEQAAKRAQRT